MDTFDAMKVFVRVAEAGSFAEAARQLDLAPASATRAVQSLEERVGFRLFHRTTRRVALTESGGRYMETVKRALAEIGGLEEALRGEVSAEVRGTLKLTMPVALGVQHIVPLLAEFKRAHPKLRMDLDFSDSVVDLLGDGYDAAIRVSARLADSSLSARRIGSSPMVISASPDYLRRHGTNVCATRNSPLSRWFPWAEQPPTCPRISVSTTEMPSRLSPSRAWDSSRHLHLSFPTIWQAGGW
jgi:DNA-binding transcriptional LysR family regulator